MKTKMAVRAFLLLSSIPGLLPHVAASTATDCIAPPSGLIGWWPGDGDARDLAGHNDGVLTNVSFAQGLVGQAFRFIGSQNLGVDSYVEVPNRPEFSALTNVTLECWFWNDSTKPFSRVLTLTPDWARLGLDGSGHPQFILALTSGQLSIAQSSQSVSPNEWHHFAGAFDGQEVRVYFDGTVAGVTSAPGSMANNGAAPGIYINFFGSEAQGLIDEAAIYNRALTPAEVHAHFAAGAAGICKQTSLAITVAFPGTAWISVKGPSLSAVEVDASTDLVNWSPVATLTSFAGRGNAADTNAGSFHRRFYRAQSK